MPTVQYIFDVFLQRLVPVYPGPPGSQGPAGPPGTPGSDGEDGDEGPPGAPGPQGAMGPTGPAGATGPPGPPGLDGEDGDDGSVGPVGPQGTAGVQGPAGQQGVPGLDGADGEDGELGPPGPQGTAGTTGATGPTGPQGPPMFSDDGEDGDVGPPGVQGATGAIGPAGPQGATGPAGPALFGEDGDDGDWGPPGVTGATGPTGPQGATGATGPAIFGEDGDDGEIGVPGATGLSPGAANSVFGVAGNQIANHADIANATGDGSFLQQQSGALTWSQFTLPSVITPASLAASQNNYNPAGLATASTIRQAVNAGVTASITGLTAQSGGRRITIQNLGPGVLNLTNEDAGSTAANRFSMPGAATFELLTDGAITFLYDGTTSRWIAENMTQCVPFVQINTTTSPAAITGTVNNYNPTGVAVSGVIRQALSGSAILTGLVAQIDGRVIFVENIDTSFALTLNNEDAGSTAANRFTLPGGTALVVNPGGCIVLIYDNTSARWRTLGQIGATVPVSSPVFGLFGDGSDGPIHFDGIATITLGNNGQTIVPSGNAYTLPRDIFPTTVVIDAGVTVNEAGYFIFAKTSANGPGTLACNGGNGGNGTTVGGTGGTAAFANARYNNSGIAGVAGSIAGGTIGLINNGAPNPSPIGGGGAASGGNGTKANASGAGGSGGAGAGGAGVGNNPSSSNAGGYKVLDCVLLGVSSGGTRFILTGCSGGSGGGSASIGGGGSGAGGGYVGLFTPVVLGPLTMQANGGNGGNGNAGGNSGGGGGGGGGYAFLLALIGGANVTIQINGGVGGAKGGTGTIGGNGFTGQQIIF